MEATSAPRQRTSKLVSLDTLAGLVDDGCRLALGGFGIYNRPTAFARELIRRRRRDLTVIGTTNGHEVELLAGAGCVAIVETSYIGLEKFGLARRVRALAESGALRITDYGEVLSFDRFRASEDGASMLPVSYLAGSSVLEANKDVVAFDCPLTGRPLHAVPPADPDIAVIQVPAADEYGNAMIPAARLMPQGLDLVLSRAAPRLLLTAERIVETSWLQRQPHLVQIPAFRTEAVSWAPWGAHPGPMFGYYDADEAHFAELIEAASSPEDFDRYLDTYVRGPANHGGYLDRIGLARLVGLQRRSRR